MRRGARRDQVEASEGQSQGDEGAEVAVGESVSDGCAAQLAEARGAADEVDVVEARLAVPGVEDGTGAGQTAIAQDIWESGQGPFDGGLEAGGKAGAEDEVAEEAVGAAHGRDEGIVRGAVLVGEGGARWESSKNMLITADPDERVWRGRGWPSE